MVRPISPIPPSQPFKGPSNDGDIDQIIESIHSIRDNFHSFEALFSGSRGEKVDVSLIDKLQDQLSELQKLCSKHPELDLDRNIKGMSMELMMIKEFGSWEPSDARIGQIQLAARDIESSLQWMEMKIEVHD
jgi:hypothetical protein